ncbi:PAS domain-containing sensor histidine kinase [Iningainema tapete]|uniref:histidine kinase n=1 Tax=Iningainema tapete BLCC-T55 TaxID=2748662 RepID=A0A8J6XI67_9CYAN|nr:ATP-binding protein [Iningainema tapete]MBD2772766.1 PAS domain S-box protein [Iningainema tapete BLCC-T55]
MHLHNNSELFRLFLEHTPAAVAMFDRQMRYIATSRKWLTDYGIHQRSVIGRSHYEVFPEISDKWKTVHQRCLAGSVEHCDADSFVRQDGGVEWVKWECRPWYEHNGEIGGIIFFAQLITEQKCTEEALSASEKRFYNLCANVPGVIFQLLLRSNGFLSCPYISSFSRQLFELEPQQIQQNFRQIYTLVHKSDRLFLKDSMVVSLDTLLPWVWEGRITTRTGKLKWVRAVSRPSKQADGDILWDGLIIDISDRLQAEQVLRQYHEDLEAKVQSRTAELHKANLQLQVEIKERQQIEEALRQSEARYREAAINAQNQTQQLEKTLAELTRTQTQLVQSEKMSSLGQLVAGVAHEINNPVNFIYGNLAHASEYTKDLIGLIKLYQHEYCPATPQIQEEIDAIDLDFLLSDLPKLLSSMKVGADRIRGIVRSLRNFSRHDEAEMKAVDIHEGLDSTLMILQHRLKHKPDYPGIEVIKNYGKLPLVECCAGQLNQVFMNLLANAIDALEESCRDNSVIKNANFALTSPRSKNNSNCGYKTPDPRIEIKTELLDNKHVLIRIADNGPGIAIEVQKYLFDPFFTTKPVGVGTGLGLSISYQIVVEKHRGQLHCNSECGRGTEFVIEIPLQQNCPQL